LVDVDELREPAVVIDLRAVRREQLEEEQLRVLATAVGDHPLPVELQNRLEHVRAQLLASSDVSGGELG
jgi:hypothetical protein